MTRAIRSEAELSQILARPGYRVASQVGGEKVDTLKPAASGPTHPVAASPSVSAAGSPSKYHNEQTNGYASKREALRAATLKALERTGRVRNLREQVRFLLIPEARDANGKVIERACHYIADFCYEEAPTWHPVVEDVKGMRTDLYRIKKKLLYFVHGIKIKET